MIGITMISLSGGPPGSSVHLPPHIACHHRVVVAISHTYLCVSTLRITTSIFISQFISLARWWQLSPHLVLPSSVASLAATAAEWLVGSSPCSKHSPILCELDRHNSHRWWSCPLPVKQVTYNVPLTSDRLLLPNVVVWRWNAISYLTHARPA